MDVGVAVFFVISGFLLFRPFVARQLDGQAAAAQCAPISGAACCGSSPATGSRSPRASCSSASCSGSAKNAFLYYFLLFPFASQNVALGGGPGHEGDYAIPQAWSLTAEFVFYLMLPLLALWLVRLGGEEGADAADPPRAAASASASTSSGSCSGSTSSPPTRRGSGWPRSGRRTGSTSSPSGWRWPPSAPWTHAGGGVPRFLRFLGDHPVVSWITAARRSGILCLHVPGARSPRASTAPSTGSAGSCSASSPSSCSPRRCSVTRRKGRARRVLASRPLVYLGTVSLGFYLFHLALMTNIQEWLAPAGTSGAFYGSLPTVFSLTFVASIAAGVGELPAGREAVPAAQGPAVVVGVAPAAQLGGPRVSGSRNPRARSSSSRRTTRRSRCPRCSRSSPSRRPSTTCSSCPTAPPTAPPSVAREAGVHVAVLPFNLGIGGALRTGFAFAVRHGYERAVQFDADGQHDPLAVQPAARPSRRRRRHGDRQPVRRRRRGHLRREPRCGAGRCSVLQWLVRVLVRQRFTDTSSGFRAFSRPMLEYFAATYPVEYMDSVEALVLACNAGLPGGRGRGEHARPHRRRAVDPAASSSSTTTCAWSSCCSCRPRAAASARAHRRPRERDVTDDVSAPVARGA